MNRNGSMDDIVKLRTVDYNKANTEVKKTGNYAHRAELPVKARDGNCACDRNAGSNSNNRKK